MPQRCPTRTSFEFEIRFASLFNEGRGFAFPCDCKGHVDLDSVGERARNNYFFARAMVGREFAVPQVRAKGLGEHTPRQ